jgi:hypothetical protein
MVKKFSPSCEKVLTLATFFDLINESEGLESLVDMVECSVPDLKKHLWNGCMSRRMVWSLLSRRNKNKNR